MQPLKDYKILGHLFRDFLLREEIPVQGSDIYVGGHRYLETNTMLCRVNLVLAQSPYSAPELCVNEMWVEDKHATDADRQSVMDTIVEFSQRGERFLKFMRCKHPEITIPSAVNLRNVHFIKAG